MPANVGLEGGKKEEKDSKRLSTYFSYLGAKNPCGTSYSIETRFALDFGVIIDQTHA
jgi:hypothetical protein